MWLVFTDPAIKKLHADWERIARTCVDQLRMESGRNPHDPRMVALVGELSVRDDDFRRWWGDHHVAARSRGTKVLCHRVAGELTLDWEALACVSDPEQQRVVWTAEPGTPSHDGLRTRLLGRQPRPVRFHARRLTQPVPSTAAGRHTASTVRNGPATSGRTRRREAAEHLTCEREIALFDEVTVDSSEAHTRFSSLP
ncbi:hypothetical protein [Streptomyces variegatus]|uniref:MmyB family transcriptional regulator n=1 Tax=Streptomyces variegatus TaxID=284040 RepID=UPI003C309217